MNILFFFFFIISVEQYLYKHPFFTTTTTTKERPQQSDDFETKRDGRFLSFFPHILFCSVLFYSLWWFGGCLSVFLRRFRRFFFFSMTTMMATKMRRIY
tara:strand:- start:320 stop:616 length:297 start_codon:yes stop_codon:yes gene_type:complete